MNKELDQVLEEPLVYPGESESAKGYAARAEAAAKKAEEAAASVLASYDFAMRDDGHLWVTITKEG